jgi:hypothetical protein
MTPPENTNRNTQMVQAVRAGDSLRVVGRRFGISHERVRQIVSEMDAEAIGAGMRVRADAAQEAAQGNQPELLSRTCEVCGKPFTTTDPRRVTDTSDCADLWAKGYRFVPGDRNEVRRDNVARSFVRRPEHYGPVKTRWAVKRLQARGGIPEDALAELERLGYITEAQAS